MKDIKESLISELKKAGHDKAPKMTGFRKASELTNEEIGIKRTADRIKSIKGLILNSCIAECPKCGWKQHPVSTVSITCRKCHGSYIVYPKNKRCRIAYCPKKYVQLLRELSDLQNSGRRMDAGIL